MIRPDGQRFMVLHRWLKNGRKYTRLVTADCEGKQLFNLSDEDFVSHCYWKKQPGNPLFPAKEPAGTIIICCGISLLPAGCSGPP